MVMAPVKCPYSIEGDGEPLILIHGIGAARSIWRFMVPVLREHFKVISYDLRSHGDAPLVDPNYGLDALVDDLELVRQQCAIDRAHFAGHSLGGMIGPAYARRYPDRVLSLALLSTAAGRTPADRNKVRQVIDAMQREGIPKVLGTLSDRWFTEKFIETHPQIVADRLSQVIATDSANFLNVFKIYAETEMLPWLHEITVPTLVLTGENDGGCSPRLNQQIAEQLPDSKLVVLSDYKHSILLEAGAEVARKLIDFVADIKARPSLAT